MRRNTNKKENLKRTKRLSLLLNNKEFSALGIYCSRYRIKNKSEFLRETVMRAILKRFEEEYPSLWEEPNPTLFTRHLSKD